MEQTVRSVEVVSDGLIVAFGEGTHCYFSAEFLLKHAGQGSNQIFLNYDDSAESQGQEMTLDTPAFASSSQSSQPFHQEGR